MIGALPAGAAVVYRDYDDPDRAFRAAHYAKLCRMAGVRFLVGADAALASSVEADGVHWPARMLRVSILRQAPAVLISAACHTADEIETAAKAGAQIAFLSPVFPTASHPDRPALGVRRLIALAAASPIPVIALGGVDADNAQDLAGRNVAGFAAIGAFGAGS